MSIKIGIMGYGNLGKGVECAIKQNDDMELVAIFTRREPEKLKIKSSAKVLPICEIERMKDSIDVMVLCGGSATDLPHQTPELAEMFNVVDSFDTHAKIPEHFNNVDKIAKIKEKTAIISIGWDPGLFSLNRFYAETILPEGKSYTFWGKGISQGHSDAIRRIEGVKDARQYTIPVDKALETVRNGETPEFSTREKHIRECFVVAEDGADKEKIKNEIINMPNYFADYDTTIHFITEDELIAKHSKMPHGGIVIRNGKTGWNLENSHTIEYKLNLASNPEFTSSVLVAFARAVYKMNNEKIFGCKTILDIPPAYLSRETDENLRKHLL